MTRHRSLSRIAVAVCTLVLLPIGCADEPAAPDEAELATIALEVGASAGDEETESSARTHTQFQLPAGSWIIQGTAEPEPPSDPTTPPTHLWTDITAHNQRERSPIVVPHVRIPAPPDVDLEDIWYGSVEVDVEPGDQVAVKLTLVREGDLPDSHLGFTIELGEAPSIEAVSIAPSRAQPGEPIAVVVQATDETNPESLSAEATIDDAVVFLEPVEIDGDRITFSGTLGAPVLSGIYDLELTVGAGGQGTTDSKRIVVGNPTCVPGPEVFVDDGACLSELGLTGTDPASEAYRSEVDAAIREAMATEAFRFFFRPITGAPPIPSVTTADEAWVLERIARESTLPDTACTTMTAVDPNEIFVGDGLTRGVCGAIAVVHSLAKLELTLPSLGAEPLYVDSAADADSDPDVINEVYVQTLMNNRRLMPIGTLITAHATALRSEHPGQSNRRLCAESDRYGALQEVTANRKPWTDVRDSDDITRLAESLQARMERGDDCTLLVDTRRGVAHAEHVTDVSFDADGRARVTTMNGYDQGDLRTSVPMDAGTNTWLIDPDAQATSLEESSHADDEDYREMITAEGGVHRMKLICCGAP